MATKLGMTVGRVRKIRTTLGANQMAGFVTVPSLLKLNFILEFE